MEINNLNNRLINAYKSAAGKTEKAKSGASAKTAGDGGDNFDKVEFDFGRSMGAAKADIAASAGADADASRIEKLKQAYAGDVTPVTAGQIAETIVG